MVADAGTFFIGELAERTALSRDTIRYYESLGLLPEPRRSAAGYRLYAPDDVDRVDFIGQAQALGLTLEEIQEVLAIMDQGREPCVHVRERLVTPPGDPGSDPPAPGARAPAGSFPGQGGGDGGGGLDRLLVPDHPGRASAWIGPSRVREG